MLKKLMPKKTLADRVGDAVSGTAKRPEVMKAGLGAVGGAVGLAVVSAAVSAAREREGSRRARR